MWNIERGLLWGTGSHSWGGWVVPRHAVSKLGAQDSEWCSSHPNPKPENQTSQCKPQSKLKAQDIGALKSEDRRKWMSHLKQGQIHPSNTFCSLQAPQGPHDAYTHRSRWTFFIRSTNANANLFQTHIGAPRSSILPAISAHLSSVKRTQKSNHSYPMSVVCLSVI